MSPGSGEAGVAAHGAIRLTELDDNSLDRVLSFLQSREAVQTSVLARRFRDLWKSLPVLRLTNPRSYGFANEANAFLNSMLLFRRRAPVKVLEICTGHEDSSEAQRYLDLWVRYSLSLDAQIVRVHIKAGLRWRVPTGLITSSHLRVLDLFHVILEGDRSELLDFSCCPALKDVTMKECDIITATTIMFPSVERLRINGGYICPVTKISAPNLLFLQFADCEQSSTPSFEPMPELVSAYVRLMTEVDCCGQNHETGCKICKKCLRSRIEHDKSTLLEALSNATNLELISAPEEFTFRKDLIHGPEFSNLRTLLLNEWCITSKLGPLHYFLQNSPVLEKLTLQLSQTNVDLVDNGATYGVKEPTAPKHLAVEMMHEEGDKEFPRVLDLLSSYGIASENINFQHPKKSIGPWPSASFSFEQQFGTEGNDIK